MGRQQGGSVQKGVKWPGYTLSKSSSLGMRERGGRVSGVPGGERSIEGFDGGRIVMGSDMKEGSAAEAIGGVCRRQALWTECLEIDGWRIGGDEFGGCGKNWLREFLKLAWLLRDA